MTRDEAITPVELTPLEDAIATAIYDYQRSVGLDDEAAGEDAFGIMRAVHTVIQQAFAEREESIRQAGVQQGLDMAAGVAGCERFPAGHVEAAWTDGDDGPQHYNQACDDIEAAIRKLGGGDA